MFGQLLRGRQSIPSSVQSTCTGKHVIAASKSTHVSRSWIDASSWEEIKKSFSELTAEERRHWQLAAIAFNLKMKKKSASEPKPGLILVKPGSDLATVAKGDSKGLRPSDLEC